MKGEVVLIEAAIAVLLTREKRKKRLRERRGGGRRRREKGGGEGGRGVHQLYRCFSLPSFFLVLYVQRKLNRRGLEGAEVGSRRKQAVGLSTLSMYYYAGDGKDVDDPVEELLICMYACLSL